MMAFWSVLDVWPSCSTVLIFFCMSLSAYFNSFDIFKFGGFMMLQFSFEHCSPKFWVVKVSPPFPGCCETQSIKAVKAIPFMLDFRFLVNPVPFHQMLLGIFFPPVSGFLLAAAVSHIVLAKCMRPQLAPSAIQ